MFNHNLETIKKDLKNKKRKDKSNNFIFSFLNKFLITCLITIVCLIFLKKNPYFKQCFYSAVYEKNFNFAFFNEVYNNYFNGKLPFSDFFNKNEELVFNEKLDYSLSNPYLDGVNLTVDSNYLVPSINNGLVVFVGVKENYGNVIIVQSEDGVNVWYGNLNNINVPIYKYVKKGELIGECNQSLYLVFKKDGNVLDYKKYI